MKRKIIITLVLCILALSCASAGRFSIKAQFSPYSLQSVAMESGIHYSSYGFGFKAGARYKILDRLDVGLDVSLDSYKYKALDSNYLVIGFMAKTGYAFDFTEKVFGKAEIGLGLDIRKIGGRSQAAFGFGVYMGGGYRFTDRISATAGVDIGYGFQSGKSMNSVDFAAGFRLGAVYAL
ncbi:MAG: outer membrane beta-barrel protein [Spirochaetales bacterium]|nr:outer membrane beta-barrel protein [Spirochaetales bacterium]